MNEKILILDFGGQYTQVIARRVRDLGVYSEIYPFYVSVEKIKSLNPKGIIFSGGPNSIYTDKSPKCDQRIYALGIPILGICYGMQLIASHFGGEVLPSNTGEYGRATLEIISDCLLFDGMKSSNTVWMSHGDSVVGLPEGFVKDAQTAITDIAAFSSPSRSIYGLQFHPEVDHTEKGSQIIQKFLYDVCKIAGSWNLDAFIENAIEDIRKKVGNSKVLCALSGGVDSSVAAVLIHKAIGDQLTCVFVDHGLLRHNEAETVQETFVKNFKMNLKVVDAKNRFLTALKEITDPEQKRKIIGKKFIEVFEKEIENYRDFKFLAQGTLYTDIIESGTETAHTIKSHHNVGGLPENMKMELLEPLNLLFKDEVRKVGKLLSIKDEIVHRQPFPGPGLAIRIIGEVTEQKLEILRKADHIFCTEILNNKLNSTIWQYFVVLTDLKTVGVMGDKRTYDYVLALRAVTSNDGMTADWAKIPYNILENISNKIINEVNGINRVVYDITSKPPSTIEWE